MQQDENLYTPNCIRTFSGHYIDPFDPDPDKICIEDIAHALSMQPRFGGHLPLFYSVAEHSLMCSLRLVFTKYELAALLHDASEAYLLDIPSPIKSRLLGYKEVEDNLMRVIATKFGFEYPLSKEVKQVDLAQLEWEWDFIMLQKTGSIGRTLGQRDLFTQKSIEKAFLKRYKQITSNKTNLT